MKKLLSALVVVAFALGLAASLPVSTVSAAPYCGITWGSLPKTAGPMSASQVVNARVGQHTCYDRIAIDLNGPASGYDVRYVSNVYADGSGQLIPLSGGAKLQIVLKAPAYNNSGNSTYPGAVTGQKLPRVTLTGFKTFRDAKYAGSFEGQTTIGLGVRATLPFHVVKSGNVVYIDVAHQW